MKTGEGERAGDERRGHNETMTFKMTQVYSAERVYARLKPMLDAVQKRLADRILSDCRPYVPYDTGMLCMHVKQYRNADGSESIVWDMPYAHAVYYGDERGVTFHTVHHPWASARWFECAKVRQLPEWIEEGRWQLS